MKTKFFLKGFSIAKALELQERAQSKEEATAAYNGSCDRCTELRKATSTATSTR